MLRLLSAGPEEFGILIFVRKQKNTRITSYGVKIVVRRRSRAKFARSNWRDPSLISARSLLRTLRSRFATIYLLSMLVRFSKMTTSSNCFPFALCMFITITPVSDLIPVAMCS